MAVNMAPIFSRASDIQGEIFLTAPVATTGTGYTGADANAVPIYFADPVNGGYVQKIRIKANATQPVNVVRFWYCSNNGGSYTTTTTAPQTPTATISSTSGVMTPGVYYMKVQALDAYEQPGAWSTEISNTVPATGNNIVWGWSAPATVTQGVSQYRLSIGLATGQQQFSIANVVGTTYTQNTTFWIGALGNQTGEFASPNALLYNTSLIGEISIPAITASATAATAEFDYPINAALPPGWRILAGLGSTSANGLSLCTYAGRY